MKSLIVIVGFIFVLFKLLELTKVTWLRNTSGDKFFTKSNHGTFILDLIKNSSSKVDAQPIGDYSDDLDEDDLACINELHLNRDDIAALDMGKTLPETDNVAKFIGCTAKKQDVITPSNHIDFAKFLEQMLDLDTNNTYLSPEMVSYYKQIMKTLIDGCHQPDHGEDVEHTLVKTMNCLTKKINEITGE